MHERTRGDQTEKDHRGNIISHFAWLQSPWRQHAGLEVTLAEDYKVNIYLRYYE